MASSLRKGILGGILVFLFLLISFGPVTLYVYLVLVPDPYVGTVSEIGIKLVTFSVSQVPLVSFPVWILYTIGVELFEKS